MGLPRREVRNIFAISPLKYFSEKFQALMLANFCALHSTLMVQSTSARNASSCPVPAFKILGWGLIPVSPKHGIKSMP